jgi:large subunit ribosomal protein L23
MHKYDVLIRPVITEKSDRLSDSGNQVIFQVRKEANKRQVAEAVEAVFKVKVTDVHTMVMPGKTRRWGRHITKTPRWKKAVITLAPGDKIDLIE